MKRAALWAAALAAALAAAWLVFGTGTGGQQGYALRADDRDIVTLGAGIYAAQCASCHGADLEGQPDWRVPKANGRLPAPPHDASGHTWHHDGETLFRLTKYGVAALIGDPDYASDMPAYEDILTDGEIIAVLSYIKSTWPQDIRDRYDQMEK